MGGAVSGIRYETGRSVKLLVLVSKDLHPESSKGHLHTLGSELVVSSNCFVNRVQGALRLEESEEERVLR